TLLFAAPRALSFGRAPQQPIEEPCLSRAKALSRSCARSRMDSSSSKLMVSPRVKTNATSPEDAPLKRSVPAFYYAPPAHIVIVNADWPPLARVVASQAPSRPSVDCGPAQRLLEANRGHPPPEPIAEQRPVGGMAIALRTGIPLTQTWSPPVDRDHSYWMHRRGLSIQPLTANVSS
ncbi:MAG: hypothetical protein M3356_00090, partial [Actinomycetota bacterium]|nr:hypothetical protein [Actinomycetota bacterium]